MSQLGSAGRLNQPPPPPPPLPLPLPLPLLLLLLLLLMMMASVTAQGPIPAPPPAAVHLGPVGVDLPQYPSFIGVAAEIRRGMFFRGTSLEQLNIRPNNDSTITVRGQTYQLDDNGTVTVGLQRLKVSGDAVSVNGVWHYPAPKTPRRRKPVWEALPTYDGRPISDIQIGTVLSVAVPAAATMLVLLLCCLACTHRSCWCCGLCDGKLSTTEIRKLFDSNDDNQPLVA